MRDLVVAYSLVQPDVKFVFKQSGKPEFVRPIQHSISESICHVFGPTLVAQLQYFEKIITNNLPDDELPNSDDEDARNSLTYLFLPFFYLFLFF